MTQAQQYIDTLLGHIPTWELKSIEDRNMFDEIKERLATSEDLTADLAALYRVKGLADFALCLLWIMEKAETNPWQSDPSADEENLVFTMFKKARGGESASSLLDSLSAGSASEPLSAQGQQSTNPFAGFSFESSASPQKSNTAVTRYRRSSESRTRKELCKFAGKVFGGHSKCGRGENLAHGVDESGMPHFSCFIIQYRICMNSAGLFWNS